MKLCLRRFKAVTKKKKIEKKNKKKSERKLIKKRLNLKKLIYQTAICRSSLIIDDF